MPTMGFRVPVAKGQCAGTSVPPPGIIFIKGTLRRASRIPSHYDHEIPEGDGVLVLINKCKDLRGSRDIEIVESQEGLTVDPKLNRVGRLAVVPDIRIDGNAANPSDSLALS